MSRSVFRRLRRCRALLVLALCAWMTLASATVWARAAGACPSMHAGSAMLVHGRPLHGEGLPCAPACDVCAHAPATLPAPPSLPVAVALARPHWRPASVRMPRPAQVPPLRPPLA